MSEKYSKKFACYLGFNDELAHVAELCVSAVQVGVSQRAGAGVERAEHFGDLLKHVV
jgi:hypothetical protein